VWLAFLPAKAETAFVQLQKMVVKQASLIKLTE
jgi:hypothetical protein